MSNQDDYVKNASTANKYPELSALLELPDGYKVCDRLLFELPVNLTDVCRMDEIKDRLRVCGCMAEDTECADLYIATAMQTFSKILNESRSYIVYKTNLYKYLQTTEEGKALVAGYKAAEASLVPNDAYAIVSFLAIVPHFFINMLFSAAADELDAIIDRELDSYLNGDTSAARKRIKEILAVCCPRSETVVETLKDTKDITTDIPAAGSAMKLSDLNDSRDLDILEMCAQTSLAAGIIYRAIPEEDIDAVMADENKLQEAASLVLDAVGGKHSQLTADMVCALLTDLHNTRLSSELEGKLMETLSVKGRTDDRRNALSCAQAGLLAGMVYRMLPENKIDDIMKDKERLYKLAEIVTCDDDYTTPNTVVHAIIGIHEATNSFNECESLRNKLAEELEKN